MSINEPDIPVCAIKQTSTNITRDDFDGGPISLDEIEEGLFLGNATAAMDTKTLKKLNITHILTIDSCPLPNHITQSFQSKFIQMSDIKTENLLGHFGECIDFINSALENQNSILVHCYFGVSRSATIVIAYLMKKYNLNYEQGFARAKSKRIFIGPNPGFIKQLKLFHKMEHTIDTNHPKYKRYRLRLAADSFRKAKILTHPFMDLIKQDPGLTQIRPEPIVYRCKKCRRVVASKNNIILHKPKDHLLKSTTNEQLSQKEQDNRSTLYENLPEKLRGCSLNSDNSGKSTENENEFCKQMYFAEPLSWMKDIVNNCQGRLYCPKCNTKLGNFSWVMGCQCPCGIQVSPAFYLVPSKVEYSTVVQNVQRTV